MPPQDQDDDSTSLSQQAYADLTPEQRAQADAEEEAAMAGVFADAGITKPDTSDEDGRVSDADDGEHPGDGQDATADDAAPSDGDNPEDSSADDADATSEEQAMSLAARGLPPAPNVRGDKVKAPPAGEGNDKAQASQASPEAPAPAGATDVAAIAEKFDRLSEVVHRLSSDNGRLRAEITRLADAKATADSQPQGSSKAAAAKKAVALQLERMKENWPEIAPDLEADFAPVLEAIANAAPATGPEAIDQLVNERVSSRLDDVRVEMATATLQLARPTIFEDCAARDAQGNPVKTADGRLVMHPSLKAFLASRGDDFNAEFMQGTNPVFIAKAVDEWKAAEAKAATAKKSRQQRLAASVVPSGRQEAVAPRASVDDEEEAAMAAAVKAGRARLLPQTNRF